METIDIIIIAILIIFAFYGLHKGFIKSLISLLSGFTGIIFSILLLKPITHLLQLFNLSTILGNLFNNTPTKLLPIETFEILSLNGQVNGKILSDNILMEGIGEKLFKLLFEDIFSPNKIYVTYQDYSLSIKESFGLLLVFCLAFIIIALILGISIQILLKIFTTTEGQLRYPFIDKTLGIILGITIGFIVIFVIFLVIQILSLIPAFYDKISNFITPNSYAFKINNLTSNIVQKIFKSII